MKDGLSKALGKITAGDYTGAREALTEVDSTFKQHIADEEGQILKLLIGVYGKKEAEDAIEVFRQHRPIYTLMKAVESLSRLPSEELSSRGDELGRLLVDHTLAEERRVFPRALAAKGTRAGAPDSSPL